MVAGLLGCAAASADSIYDLVPGVDAGAGAVEPFSGMPGGDFSSPDAIAVANYWFSIVSNPWANYSLIVELFGADAAATLLADETPGQLLNPPLNPPLIPPPNPPLISGINATYAISDGEAVPEPSTALLCGAGLLALLALLGWQLISQLKKKSRPFHP